MNKQEGLNVYFYAFYDTADKHAYSGLVADTCKANVIGDIMGNFQAPVYVTVRFRNLWALKTAARLRS